MGYLDFVLIFGGVTVALVLLVQGLTKMVDNAKYRRVCRRRVGL